MTTATESDLIDDTTAQVVEAAAAREAAAAARSEAGRRLIEVETELGRMRRDIKNADPDRIAELAVAVERARALAAAAEQQDHAAKARVLEVLVELDDLEADVGTRDSGAGVLTLPVGVLGRTFIAEHPVTRERFTFTAGTPADGIPRWALAGLDRYDRFFGAPSEPAPPSAPAPAAAPGRYDRTNPGTPYKAGQTVTTGTHLPQCVQAGTSDWPNRPVIMQQQRVLQVRDSTIATLEVATCCVTGPAWQRVVAIEPIIQSEPEIRRDFTPRSIPVGGA